MRLAVPKHDNRPVREGECPPQPLTIDYHGPESVPLLDLFDIHLTLDDKIILRRLQIANGDANGK